ncbi:T9SS type A sorting domain-containing protein [Soonwooa sp.]|uniref:T9SS type A sorting domain-containing protein n=1 Tax=Soonwooa sp. TaxID=1938592 RepID=UPI0026026C72|nr:T9SS type A sorting domain-containing protein [Soonwooa sp.]
MYKISLIAFSFLGLQNVSAQFYQLGINVAMTDINNNGVAAGSSANKNNLMWTKEDGVQNIGVVSRDLLAGQSLIGADNNKIIGFMTNPDTNFNQPGIYDTTTKTWKLLGGLSGASDARIATAWGMTEDGKMIVGLGYINAAESHAVTWEIDGDNVTITDLGTTVPGRASRANTISADHSTIVGWQDSSFGNRDGAYWINGVQTLIKSVTGVAVSEPLGVSADGKVMVGASGNFPYVYNRETNTYLEIENPLVNNFYRGGATAVSADGKTVIGYYRTWPGGPHLGTGFIWTAEKGRMNLDDYVASFGIDTGGLKLSLPLAISPDGTKIAGQGMNPVNSLPYGFVVDLANASLAVSNTTEKSDVKIYPNPVKDVLSIANSKSIKSVEVINMAGQKVASATSNQINVANLPKGTYVVRVVDGNQTTTHKIVKE